MSDIDPTLSADDAIPQLVDRLGDKLYALGRRMCRTDEDAKDLVQDVFLQAYRKWDQFEGRSKASTWLYTIAVRRCQRMHRLRAGEPAQHESWEEIHPFAESMMVDESFFPADDDELDELRDLRRDAMERAIVDLPLDYRMPLLLKEIAGFSVAEVAALLGATEGAIKTRLYRARLKLRKILLADAPTRVSDESPYTKQVCADLLDAKQQALDKGVEFPLDDIICDRCRSVFRSLDVAQDLCRTITVDELSEELRDDIRRRLVSERP